MSTKNVTVVYDTRDGAIVQIHDWSGLKDAELPSESDRERDAIDLAVRNTGRQRSEFAILHAQPEDLEKEAEYTVDVQKKKPVAKDDSRIKAKK
jgi:hypothetical protein